MGSEMCIRDRVVVRLLRGEDIGEVSREIRVGPPELERRLIPPVPLSMGTGTGSAVGWINLPTCVSSVFRLVCSCCPPRFGEPKGNILRSSSAIGFNPVGGDEGRRSRSASTLGASGTGPSPRSGPEAFITNAVGDGAPVSLREVPTRVLNRYFCVSIPGMLKSRSPASQHVENLLFADNVRGCPIT